jgi:hypothetical protein
MNWAFKNKSTAETLRDIVERRKLETLRTPGSVPASKPESPQPIYGFHVQTEIPAAIINDSDPTLSEYSCQLCDVYALDWLDGDSVFVPIALTDADSITIQGWLINPAPESIPANTMIWGCRSVGSRDGVGVFMSIVWPC